MSLEMLAEEPEILRRIREKVEDERLVLDFERARAEAGKLLDELKGFDCNLGDFGNAPPIVVCRGSKYIAYIVVLNPHHILTAKESVGLVEALQPYLEKIRETGLKPILIFYSRRGVLTMTAYLYLGSVIENHDIGVLFINGGPSEVAEVLWHLENAGKYVMEEEETVELSRV